MKYTVVTLLAAAAVANAASAGPQPQKLRRAELPEVVAKGNAFWAGSERFYIRGMDYQPGGESESKDPLADTDICKRDVAAFKKLGINTIRVYITDNSVDHDECMDLLAEAGIYVMLDANNPKYSINRADPHPSYNAVYLQSVFATIDAFSKYSNTLAFFSGNEVINDEKEHDTTLSAPYVKATTRDMRAYIKARGYRSIPVGYSAADVASNRMQTAHYFNCGPDEERSDFFAFNDYSWCKSDYKTAGWDIKVRNFTGYGLPIFLSEWGCITNGRDFGEMEALMSDDMTPVYSGGLMYEYTLKQDNYGIVEIDEDENLTELPEFDAFAQALEDFPAPTGDGGYTSTTNSVPCPTKDSDWNVDAEEDLPAMPEGAKQYLNDGAGEGPGLRGGSQSAGESATPDEESGDDKEDDENAGGRVEPSRFAVTGVLVAAAGFSLAMI